MNLSFTGVCLSVSILAKKCTCSLCERLWPCVCFNVCVLSRWWWLTASCPVGRQRAKRGRCLLFHQVAIATVHSGAVIISVITTHVSDSRTPHCLRLSDVHQTDKCFPSALGEGSSWEFRCDMMSFRVQHNTKEQKKNLGETLLQITNDFLSFFPLQRNCNLLFWVENSDYSLFASHLIFLCCFCVISHYILLLE